MAGLQWGSEGVTMDPVQGTDAIYCPQSDSVVGWGTYPFYGVTDKKPEWPHYTSELKSDNLDAATVAKIMTEDPNYFGLRNTYTS